MNAKTLNPTQASMVAASLEIDGRTDIAANAVVEGNVSEFTYTNGQPFSAKAVELAATIAALDGMVQMLGVEGTVKALRGI